MPLINFGRPSDAGNSTFYTPIWYQLSSGFCSSIWRVLTSSSGRAGEPDISWIRFTAVIALNVDQEYITGILERWCWHGVDVVVLLEDHVALRKFRISAAHL
jgi:hypothetical protein